MVDLLFDLEMWKRLILSGLVGCAKRLVVLYVLRKIGRLMVLAACSYLNLMSYVTTAMIPR
jgi:hypothetical protein